MTNPIKGRPLRVADQMVFDRGLGEQVEEYELADIGHVYTLTDGNSLVIPLSQDKEPYVLVDEQRQTVDQYKEGMMD